MKKLNINTWKRKDHFLFFKDYDNPFFNITTEINIGHLLGYCKNNNISFSTAMLFLSQLSVNAVEEFRYRIKEDEVWIYDYIDCGSTVLNHDNSFRYVYYSFTKNFVEFNDEVKAENDKVKSVNSKLEARDDEDALIHYSIIPWISFTGLTHARKFSRPDSIPKIVFGKYYKKEGELVMPISIDAHHSLMDAFHVSLYLKKLQQLLNECEQNL